MLYHSHRLKALAEEILKLDVQLQEVVLEVIGNAPVLTDIVPDATAEEKIRYKQELLVNHPTYDVLHDLREMLINEVEECEKMVKVEMKELSDFSQQVAMEGALKAMQANEELYRESEHPNPDDVDEEGKQ